MLCYEDEGSWSLSFSGAGFLGLYHVGVTRCLSERAPHLLQGARRFYGSSSGALNAVSIIAGKSVDFCCSHLLGMVKHVEQLSLGIFHPAFAPIEHIRQQLQDSLPSNIHILASQRLGISLTHWPDGHNIIVTSFTTREEVIQALVCSLYFPFYCGTIPPEFRGERYIDGALSNNLPFADCPSIITVSPFHGTVDICPQSTSASMHELNAFNASFQISTKNFFLGFTSLIPPSPEDLPRNQCFGCWCRRSPQPQLMAARTPAMTEARRGACLSTGQCPMCWSRTCATLSSSHQSWRLVLPRPSCTCPPTPCPAHRGRGAETLCARSVPQRARSLPTAQGSAGSTERRERGIHRRFWTLHVEMDSFHPPTNALMMALDCRH
ncbi:patatin-like phospholipase domain-containing protein 5 isoform X3 [Ailuropoda melanoleuca]|uniref:patatin-like phospholipase domain-containing protein 5 isoform X3 n=1 Tax=Ailuropoda melanoleuca TaxID=9646 RepID=UPI001494FB85|nr:patatin-like phospholipase domain-containing protein 5 isoform X3 [Ailuropoda melanoleuca]XP_034500252.1 patatin-like phospholipase domain-containing protein 5 isoform X3 [Ailuropoda melanoleuca]